MLQTQKDLPFQFLTSSQPARASIVLASFGSTTPTNKHVFDLDVTRDAAAPLALPPTPERYTSKPEINHIFKADAKSPPKLISHAFMLAVLFALPGLIGLWVGLGGNLAADGTPSNTCTTRYQLATRRHLASPRLDTADGRHFS